MGLVQEVFNDEIIERLQGDIAIGHVRYSTAGESHAGNAMPLVIYLRDKAVALAHNGNLVNARILKQKMQNKGVIFQTEIDSEVIAALIARYGRDVPIEEATEKALKKIQGAYALVITTGNKLIGVRDPNGLRPLCIGKNEDGYILSSESCVFPPSGREAGAGCGAGRTGCYRKWGAYLISVRSKRKARFLRV